MPLNAQYTLMAANNFIALQPNRDGFYVEILQLVLVICIMLVKYGVYRTCVRWHYDPMDSINGMNSHPIRGCVMPTWGTIA